MQLTRLLHYRDLATSVLRKRGGAKTPRRKRAEQGASKIRAAAEASIVAELRRADAPVIVEGRAMLWLLRDRDGYLECDPATGKPLRPLGQEYRRLIYRYPDTRRVS